jgi:hypothetical protein
MMHCVMVHSSAVNMRFPSLTICLNDLTGKFSDYTELFECIIVCTSMNRPEAGQGRPLAPKVTTILLAPEVVLCLPKALSSFAPEVASA